MVSRSRSRGGGREKRPHEIQTNRLHYRRQRSKRAYQLRYDDEVWPVMVEDGIERHPIPRVDPQERVGRRRADATLD